MWCPAMQFMWCSEQNTYTHTHTRNPLHLHTVRGWWQKSEQHKLPIKLCFRVLCGQAKHAHTADEFHCCAGWQLFITVKSWRHEVSSNGWKWLLKYGGAFLGGSFNAIYTTENRIFCVVNCNKPSKKSVLSFVLFLFSLLYVGSE